MDLAELTKMYDFAGRSVVMTGGTGVLGRHMVQALVGCGANVSVLARSRQKAAAVLAEITGPGRVEIIEGDALRKDDLQRAAEAITKEFGRVDCLVNGAGGNHPQATTRPDLSFFDIPEEAFRFVFDLNLLGTILPSQVLGKLMAGQGEGVILNVSSMSALRPLTRVVSYSAAKAGINSFTNGWPCISHRNTRRAYASTPS